VLTGQLTLSQLIRFLKRRKVLIILTPLVSTLLAVVVALVLPRKYESETTILVQREDILNPLVSFSIAIVQASEDRLRTLDEIVYSRKTIEIAIDSLGLASKVQSPADHEALITQVKKNIRTGRRGADVFSLTYSDEDPIRAQRGATLIADYVIEVIVGTENRRNEDAVVFFESKLEEYRGRYDRAQRDYVAAMQQNLSKVPNQIQDINTKLRGIEGRIDEIDERIQSFQEPLKILRSFPEAFETEDGRKSIYGLYVGDLPLTPDLRSAMADYTDFSQKYTSAHPNVEKAKSHVLDILERMKIALENQLAQAEQKRYGSEADRASLLDEFKNLSDPRVGPNPDQSNVEMYGNIYEEMKVKLEQARMTRDLGRKSREKFVVLDPAIVPLYPTKPNRPFVVAAGLAIGLIIGVITALLTEALDTTVRSPSDIEFYQKRIIAYLPDLGHSKKA